MASGTDCLDEQAIVEALLRDPRAPLPPHWEKHLSECTECRRLVSELARSSLIPRASKPDSPPPVATQRSAPPSGPTPSQDGSVMVGDVIADKYRVERVIGRGGMGMVVSATHVQLGHRVALKFLLPDIADDPRAVKRFLLEGRAAARIGSDHVARVLDVGTLSGGQPYLVMEFLQGTDLGTLLRVRGPLAIELALDYVIQACDAVSAAHKLRVVHRDLKPSNLFLTSRNDGTPLVKVLDFGISKVLDPLREGSTMTTDATVVGSPSYMSPEQMLRPREVDFKTDVWSLGVLLYELVSGRLPFEAETMLGLCAAVQTEQPLALRQARADAPAALETVVARCLQKDPANRWESVAELVAALAPMAPPSVQSCVRHILHGPVATPAPLDAPEMGTANTLSLAAAEPNARTGSRRPFARGLWRWMILGVVAGALWIVVGRWRRLSPAMPPENHPTAPAVLSSQAALPIAPPMQSEASASPSAGFDASDLSTISSGHPPSARTTPSRSKAGSALTPASSGVTTAAPTASPPSQSRSAPPDTTVAPDTHREGLMDRK
jgi:eukaryotic-like serine/threonine-protein kinase